MAPSSLEWISVSSRDCSSPMDTVDSLSFVSSDARGCTVALICSMSASRAALLLHTFSSSSAMISGEALAERAPHCA
uniref:Uncharacterized protein n=1 Tax=Arundo donax TaxID=35708 RepID=A0A0A8Z3Z2_ARUDO